MKEYRITDDSGSYALILPEKGATLISLCLEGQELFYKDPDNLSSPERPRCGVPFLFPAFGRTPEDSPYPMTIHGFGHTSSWDVVSQDRDTLQLSLSANEETLAVYPFQFRVLLTFTIRSGCLTIRQRYENHGPDTMPFSFGFHPYFHTTDPESVRVNVHAETEVDMMTGKGLPWGEKAAFVTFPAGAPETGGFFSQVKDHAILHTGTGKPIRMAFDGHFTRLVLWAVRGKEFLCVEPINSSPNGLATGDCFRLAPGESMEAEISFSLVTE